MILTGCAGGTEFAWGNQRRLPRVQRLMVVRGVD